MSGPLRDRLREMYDPDTRVTKLVLSGSAFVLLLFLASPDPTNPYYVGGVTTAVFAIVVSVAILALERRR